MRTSKFSDIRFLISDKKWAIIQIFAISLQQVRIGMSLKAVVEAAILLGKEDISMKGEYVIS